MDILEERNLINLIKKGDKAAFEQLLTHFEKKVYNTALRYCKNRDDAFDIAQDVFLRVYRYIGDFKGDSSLSTWIYRITVNLCADYVRRSSSSRTVSLYISDDEEEHEIQLADDAPSPEEAFESKEKAEIIRRAIDRLPDEYREIIVLRDIDGLQYEEIAKVLEINIGTVKSRISRARQRLRRILTQIGNFFDNFESN